LTEEVQQSKLNNNQAAIKQQSNSNQETNSKHEVSLMHILIPNVAYTFSRLARLN
jgi:hypothetical protein